MKTLILFLASHRSMCVSGFSPFVWHLVWLLSCPTLGGGVEHRRAVDLHPLTYKLHVAPGQNGTHRVTAGHGFISPEMALLAPKKPTLGFKASQYCPISSSACHT